VAPSKTILIIAGEASGDLYGAELISKLRNKFHNLNFIGMGGEKIEREKLSKFISNKSVTVTGGVEVFKKINYILKAYRYLKNLIKNTPIDVAILIDFPDFNFQLFRHLKKKGIPIIYYVSPQLWAWRKGRVKKIQKYVDDMLVIFPFEVDWYKQHEVYAHYVGHPLAKLCEDIVIRRQFPKSKIKIGIFPGSRDNEVKRLMPPMIEAAEKLSGIINAEFYLFTLSHIDKIHYDAALTSQVPINMIIKENMNQLKDIDFALACSGTLTVELALLKIPMIILYKLSPISYCLSKLLVRGVKNIGMANLILGESYFPELFQNEVKPRNIVTSTLAYLKNESRYNEALGKLDGFRDKLLSDKNAIALEQVVGKYLCFTI